MATGQSVIDLAGDLEVSGAENERQKILSIFEDPEASTLEIEIHGKTFTQPALQILFATLREAAERHHACRLGPNAETILKSRLDTGKGAAA